MIGRYCIQLQLWAATNGAKCVTSYVVEILYARLFHPIDEESIGLLRDGTEALVGMLAMVTGVRGVDIDESMQ
jgi:hypothetical protein